MEYSFDFNGHAGGVETASIGDDFDALGHAQFDHILELFKKGANVTHMGAALFALIIENFHGQFSEIVAGQDVDGATFDHFFSGRQAIAIKSAAISDSNGFFHRFLLRRQ